MRARRPFLVLLLLVTAVLIYILFSRRATRANFGPAATLCPGPDWYGYTCNSGAGYAYIDATQDTALYEDDGFVRLELPFPFTFYGATYTELNASSNGTLQFGSANPAFGNDCLIPQPAPGMGAMIAPFWDDLDLRFQGFLETETVGEPPNRIFVVEWDDVPRFGDDLDDRLTFAVQLFEGSNDILFLYEDATTFEGHNGRSATIGLQSEEPGLAMQFSCNQPAVADTGSILFSHPSAPNQDVSPNEQAAPAAISGPEAKGIAVDLAALLNRRGLAILPQLQTHWRSQTPSRAANWDGVDLTGNGRSELILLWSGGPKHPELAQLAVLSSDESGQFNLLLDQTFSTRSVPVANITLVETADLTQDGRPDVLLQTDTGQLYAITKAGITLSLEAVPERCLGGLALLDADEDGGLDIIRDNCEREGRVTVSWNGRQFVIDEQ